MSRVTLSALQQMKRDGRKIVGVVLYDCQMAQIADRAAVDIVSVGDSVAVNLWGRASEADVTLDEMLLVCQAVRRGVARALVSCDLPVGALEDGRDAGIGAARRLIEAGGADIVKVDAAATSTDGVRAIVEAGIPVWAQFNAAPGSRSTDQLVREALSLQTAGASLLDFRYSGSVAGPAVVRAVDIPVIGGLGGGPWLDGRVRALVAAIGYMAAALDDQTERYANVADLALTAINSFSDDVRAARQIRGAGSAVPTT